MFFPFPNQRTDKWGETNFSLYVRVPPPRSYHTANNKLDIKGKKNELDLFNIKLYIRYAYVYKTEQRRLTLFIHKDKYASINIKSKEYGD